MKLSQRTQAPAPTSENTHVLDACPICGGTAIEYVFTMQDQHVWECAGCSSLFLNPQPDDQVLGKIYGDDYFLGGQSEADLAQREEMKRATARLYLDQLDAYAEQKRGKLLEIGCGQGELLVEAESRGYNVTGIEYSEHAASLARQRLHSGEVFVGELETAQFPAQSFDVVIHADVIEHVRDPRAFMMEINRILKPGGILMMVTISIDSWTSRLLKHNWMEFKVEHMSYFSDNALQGLMFSSGFEGVRLFPTYKLLTPKYILAHFKRYPVPFFTALVGLGYRFLPKPIREHKFRLTGSGITVIGRTTAIPDRRKLSVVMAVYNEAATVRQVMDGLLALPLHDLDMEIIVVESNSTDGTREIVESYRDQSIVRLIYQDRPSGKGSAVRAGLAQATGDFIIIQDADLEYDLNDYAKLLAPLRAGQRPFVLGSRHLTRSSWNMRTFENNVPLALTMNFGHVFFCTLLNLLYGKHLKDPFTMYKVFYRDCLEGLRLESNRFDFDFELVIKLLRKGYSPLEIPVNYHSRSPKEGKKVSVLRDPITWIVALVKFRFAPLYNTEAKQQRSSFEPAPSELSSERSEADSLN